MVVFGILLGELLQYLDMMELNEDTFYIFAVKHYDNPSCMGTEELNEDLKRFVYLRRLLTRYKTTDELNENLILNHLIVLYNVFDQAATDMLVFKLRDLLPYLKPFLLFLKRIEESELQLVVMDDVIVEKLRKI